MNELGEFLSEEDLSRAAPVQRGVLYWVDASGTDSTAVEVLFVDDAADAFPSEGVHASAETGGLVDGTATVVVPQAPKMTFGLAAACVTLAAGVLTGLGVIVWLLPPNEVNRATQLSARDRAQVVASAAPATVSPRVLAKPVSAPPIEAPPAAVPVQATRPAIALPATSAVRSRSVPPAPPQLTSASVSRPIDTQVDTQTRPVANVEIIAAPPAPEIVSAARIPESLPTVAVNRGDGLASSPPPAAADASALIRTPAPPTSLADTVPVRELLARYRAAYEKLDARSAKQIWPTVDERALARAFEGLDSQAVTFDTCDLAVTEARASASCRGSASYVTRVGNRNIQTTGRQWHFQMQKTADQWVIASVQTR